MTLVLLLLLGLAAGCLVRCRAILAAPAALAAMAGTAIAAAGNSVADTPLLFAALLGTAGIFLGRAVALRR